MSEPQSLVTSPIFVQTPVVKIIIGDYEFGVYDKNNKGFQKYPNYIQSLEITKINGKVNIYTAVFNYPINEFSDPNYFEKVFSSVSESRKIEFTYGDASAPNFMYKNESGIITKVKSNFQLDSSSIIYTVSAVSNAALGLSGSYTFPPKGFKKPSLVFREILQDAKYGLQDLFGGMKNMTKVDMYGLIPSTDKAVNIEGKDNMSVLEYLMYLVSLMTGGGSKKSIYILTFEDDTSGVFDGSFMRILEVDSAIQHPEAYQLDIGYPGSNYVYNFSVENDENYSIFYNYQSKLHPQEYVTRINQNGDYEEIYAPVISSNNPSHDTEEDEKTWWAKVTNFPIKASLTIKGLLRPAILMNYVRLNIIMFGQKHINSGLYVITKQVDTVNADGYKTVLNLTRISGDE